MQKQISFEDQSGKFLVTDRGETISTDGKFSFQLKGKQHELMLRNLTKRHQIYRHRSLTKIRESLLVLTRSHSLKPSTQARRDKKLKAEVETVEIPQRILKPCAFITAEMPINCSFHDHWTC